MSVRPSDGLFAFCFCSKTLVFIDGFFSQFGMCTGVGHALLGIANVSHAYIHYINIQITTKVLRISPSFKKPCLFFCLLFRSAPQNTNHPYELVFCGTERNQHNIARHILVCYIMFSCWQSVCPSVNKIDDLRLLKKSFVPFRSAKYQLPL